MKASILKNCVVYDSFYSAIYIMDLLYCWTAQCPSTSANSNVERQVYLNKYMPADDLALIQNKEK
jgi:hypothetical protein